MRKHLNTALKKSQRRLFRPFKFAKLTLSHFKCELRFNKISIFGVIYISTFAIVNTIKSGTLKAQKMMPEHFINNIETILKKSGLQLYIPKSGPNMSNNLTKCVYFRATSFNFGMLVIGKNYYRFPWYLKTFVKKKKNAKFWNLQKVKKNDVLVPANCLIPDVNS